MSLTTGELAERAKVNIETVRYYERRGLLPQPPRTASGYRQYAPEAVARLRFIKRAQNLGFSLQEIGTLLDLRVRRASGTVCREVESRAAAKMELIEGKIRELERMRGSLERLVSACRDRETTGDCPILEALEPDGMGERAGRA